MDIHTNAAWQLVERSGVIAGIVGLFLVLTYLIRILATQRVLRKIPQVGGQHGGYLGRLKAFAYQAESLYKEGYEKFTKSAYRMTTIDGRSPFKA